MCFFSAIIFAAAQAEVAGSIDLRQIFQSSPVIYSILLFLSLASVSLYVYSLITCRKKELIPQEFVKKSYLLLQKQDHQKLLRLCKSEKHVFSAIVIRGLESKSRGLQAVLHSMESQGKTSLSGFWSRLSILNDIAVISPMFGLLGTILGMFYAFYDTNRSIESIQALFDGLGIAIGTTVAGLIVAISSMIFSAFLKHRLVHILQVIQNESVRLGHLLTPEQEV